MKHLFITIVFLSFISFSWAVLSQSFETEVVLAKVYQDTINRTGKLAYKRTLSLSFKSGGYLALLNIDEGEKFSKGQLLASLDVTELTEQKNSLFAQLLQAKREVTRIKSLMKNQLASGRELDIANTNVKRIRANYQVAFYNLEKAQIIAPFAGVVIARNVELGELQTPGFEVLKVAKLDKNLVVKVALSGQEVAQVKLQQKVKVILNRLGVVEGYISKIPVIANEKNQLFIIEILLPSLQLSPGVIAGQLARVVIEAKSDEYVYQLPIDALVGVDGDGQAMVITQPVNSTEFVQRYFEIFQLDNAFVYLKAPSQHSQLKVITKGWQNKTFNGK